MSEASGSNVAQFPERGVAAPPQVSTVRLEGQAYDALADASMRRWQELVDAHKVTTSHDAWALQGKGSKAVSEGLQKLMGGIIQGDLGTYRDFGIMGFDTTSNPDDEEGSSVIVASGADMGVIEVDGLRQRLAADANRLLEQLHSPLRLSE